VFSFGDAAYAGSLGGTPLNQPIVAIAATPTGNGYWLAAADGGVFSFGDAAYEGSGAGSFDSPTTAILAVRSGRLLVSRDGSVLPLGRAAYCGGLGDRQINKPLVAASP
jgi:hypothetical protein